MRSKIFVALTNGEDELEADLSRVRKDAERFGNDLKASRN